MSTSNRNISSELYAYILEHSLREPPVLERLRKETEKLPNNQMQISPDQGQFMGILARLIGARKTLEMGVFTGYSSLVVALALPDDGKVVACDISDEFTSRAKPYWEEAGVAHKIDLRLGPALDTLDGLLANGEAGDYDFAFIDADKEGYPDYYERCSQLVRQGGLILFDNMFGGGRVLNPPSENGNPPAVHALNAALKTDARIDLSLLPLGDGLTVARKR